MQDYTVWTRYFVAENVLDEVTFGWPRQSGGSQLKELLALRLQKAFTSVSSLTKLIPSSSSSFYSPLDLQFILIVCGYQHHSLSLLQLPGWSYWNFFGPRSTITKWWLQTSACISYSVSKSLVFWWWISCSILIMSAIV